MYSNSAAGKPFLHLILSMLGIVPIGLEGSQDEGCDEEPPGISDPTLIPALESAFNTTLGAPGATTSVLIPGTGLWKSALGFSDLKRSVPMPSDGLFAIASPTKTFVSALVLRLDQEGVLSIEDLVDRWIPGYFDNKGIRLKHLLGHTSGIYEYLNSPAYWTLASKGPVALEQIASIAAGQPVGFVPGSSFSYTNTNYILLGMVIAAATGHAWHEVLRTKILDSLDLCSTFVLGLESPPMPLVDGFDTGNSYFPSGLPDGDIASTAGDLCRWMAALFGDRIIDGSHLQTMVTPGPDPGYALGLRIYQADGETIYGHTGAFLGHTTFISYRSKTKIAGAILFNADTDATARVDLLNSLTRVAIGYCDARPGICAPEARIALTPAQGPAPLEVLADGSASIPMVGTAIAEYRWTPEHLVEDRGGTASYLFDEPGRHVVGLTVVTSDGNASQEITAAAEALCAPGDVSPWTAVDIGTPSFAGSSRKEGDCISICAGGSLLLGTHDNVHFVHRRLTGDLAMVLTIEDVEGATTAQVGLMARDSLDPGAVTAAVGILRLGTADRFRFNSRAVASRAFKTTVGGPASPPARVKLERIGNEVIGASSTDGTTWVEVGRLALAGSPEDLLIGIFAATGEPDAGTPFLALRARACLDGPPPTVFRRGDSNADGSTDLSDAIAILNYLFLGEKKVPCEQSGDVNDDGSLDISDAVDTLSFLYLGGKAVEPPVGTCGVDPTGHDLPCAEFPGCQ